MKKHKFLEMLVLLFIVGAILVINPNSGLANPKQQDFSKGLDHTSRIAIISAFDEELEALKAQATINKTVVINGRSIYIGVLGGHKVVLTLSGISMVNAAMVTQTLIDHFRIQQIVFSGIGPEAGMFGAVKLALDYVVTVESSNGNGARGMERVQL